VETPLDGRVALVTGGNVGLGLETAVALAAMGAQVVFTSRDTTRGHEALREVRRRADSDAVDVLPLDLARLESVRSFVDTFGRAHDRLDVLVNNAGLISRTRERTVDGYEMTFQVNHLGPFLLTTLLHDRLATAADARIVNVSSVAHRLVPAGLDFSDLQSERRYRAFGAYCRAKLANVLFTRELARRWAGDGIIANAAHPGYVASRWGRDGDLGPVASAFLRLGRPLARTPGDGARTQIHLASAPEVAGTTGGYWVRSGLAQPSAAARDDEAATRLWEISEALVGTP
jgi:NAD(P)-dependent dehydrogenase (short-subunit alcohol dehydrogenase family)